MSEPVLSVRNLVAGYEPGVPIVRGASITVAEKEIVVVLGPNGAGKSSFIKAIAGLVPVESGTVELGGRDITSTPAHIMVRLGLAFVPQTENVFPLMSVEDNLKVAGGILKPKDVPARIDEMYATFPDLARHRRIAAGNLSGGQRQMLAVARALIVHPKLLVLDEPSAGLSPKFVSMVFDMLSEIRKSGVTILLVEQNAKAALAIGDRAYVLVEGKDRHEGVASELWSDPVVAELYLGQRPATSARGGAA
ncbi:branched-chain amino acid transport system ATP-binding protein [Rhizobium sp. ERR 922]|uniref:ABC transporter ATP-binding protein n=1 Tax=unclassified Rhizobium TaxID=2613769 RepID=UPI0011A29661|nr:MULTISPECIES: ABC transporter ATP-binding protein [unclassified Rhizobium]TWB58464.1 branched-chain amino acid transport system ATP-binding protein [Rhizobium sp. ERR 922]TWC00160.1 branched-chain amino acid transport system ATP-binding protein [Rhizobium sp. ERR 942]